MLYHACPSLFSDYATHYSAIRNYAFAELHATSQGLAVALQNETSPCFALPSLIGATPSFAIALLRLYQPVLVLPRHSRALYSQAVAN